MEDAASGFQHRFIEANGIRFHYVEQGSGPVVLLLHGFPECWYSWRNTLPALAAAGFRAVAPDMRGYNLTDKPRDGYNIESLVEDIAALARALGEERMHLVGHDWGGVVAWQVASRRPEAVRTLTIMNAPHPSAFARYIRASPGQMLRSTYMLFFRLPRLPEWLLTRNRAAAIANAFRRSAARPGVFSDADLEVYREAFLRPGAARCTLAYYRQALRQGRSVLPRSPVLVPTLVLWGEDDPVLPPVGNRRLGTWVKDLTYEPVPGCGHWTQQERPDVVNPRLASWLDAHRAYP
jgi:pimeloyl-ACP methyl ester carboxylesterase